MANAGLHLVVSCVICGNAYRQSRSDQMYCAGRCASISWRNRNYKYSKLSCVNCGNEYTRLHSRQKYCSKTCQVKADALRKKIVGGPGKGWSKGTNISIESIMKAAKTKAKNGTLQNMNRANASWKAEWREIGGIRKYFRSSWEANYARYLEWLKSKGEILSWEHEPETFWFDGVKRGCVSYLPDFLVIEKDKSKTYHEVKGWMDMRSKTKIKRMSKYYPKIKMVLIQKKEYMAIARSMKGLIPTWE